MMLIILEQRLKLFEVTDLEWLHRAICWELPENPVYYPTSQNISQIYEKSELAEWFKQHPGCKRDPGGLSENVTLSDYVCT